MLTGKNKEYLEFRLREIFEGAIVRKIIHDNKEIDRLTTGIATSGCLLNAKFEYANLNSDDLPHLHSLLLLLADTIRCNHGLFGGAEDRFVISGFFSLDLFCEDIGQRALDCAIRIREILSSFRTRIDFKIFVAHGRLVVGNPFVSKHIQFAGQASLRVNYMLSEYYDALTDSKILIDRETMELSRDEIQMNFTSVGRIDKPAEQIDVFGDSIS